MKTSKKKKMDRHTHTDKDVKFKGPSDWKVVGIISKKLRKVKRDWLAEQKEREETHLFSPHLSTAVFLGSSTEGSFSVATFFYKSDHLVSHKGQG